MLCGKLKSPSLLSFISSPIILASTLHVSLLPEPANFPIVNNANNFNYKKAMNTKSKALSRSLLALQESFPTLILPTPHASQSLFSYIENITAQLIPSSHLKTVIEQMRQASDAQEYRIQRNILDMEVEAHDHFMEEICYEAHSTGILAEREIFSVKIEADGASIVDDVWWNAEKKMEEIEYFMD